MSRAASNWLLSAGLALLVVLTFLPALGCGFVAWDDPQTVPAYAIVLRGLSLDGVRWAFTHGYFAHWLPLTVLSHMLDWQLFGNQAAGHHLSSLVLHAATVVLVFQLWRRTTLRPLRAAAVAALFAVHPLRVEPVVWVAARKDMLSGFFGVLALVLYVGWVARRGPWRYAAVTVALLLGLLSKPMVVSLPVAMLLLDFWPLGRLPLPVEGPPRARLAAFLRGAWPLLREKLPWLALAVAGAAGAVVSQRLGGAMAELQALSLGERLGNAFLSYAGYLADTLWPAGLAAFYAFRDPPAPWALVLPAVALFVALTAGALAAARRWPWLTVGWLWFVVALLPVIGLVQVGDQASADRYTYLPSVGLLAAIVWSAAEAARSRPARVALGGLTAALLVVCFGATRAQIATWRDTPNVFGQILRVDPRSHVGHINLGTWLNSQGRYDEAIEHFRRAIERRPQLSLAHVNLGDALRRAGRRDEAERELRLGVELAPAAASGHVALAALYDDRGQLGLAAGHLASAIVADPAEQRAWAGLGAIAARPGGARQALPYVAAVARSHPESPELQRVLAFVRQRAGVDDGARPSG
jgi:tetratricopeptide (TPR) repeat protein